MFQYETCEVGDADREKVFDSLNLGFESLERGMTHGGHEYLYMNKLRLLIKRVR